MSLMLPVFTVNCNAVAGATAGCDDDIARGRASGHWSDDASIAPSLQV